MAGQIDPALQQELDKAQQGAKTDHINLLADLGTPLADAHSELVTRLLDHYGATPVEGSKFAKLNVDGAVLVNTYLHIAVSSLITQLVEIVPDSHLPSVLKLVAKTVRQFAKLAKRGPLVGGEGELK